MDLLYMEKTIKNKKYISIGSVKFTLGKKFSPVLSRKLLQQLGVGIWTKIIKYMMASAVTTLNTKVGIYLPQQKNTWRKMRNACSRHYLIIVHGTCKREGLR